MFLKSLPSWQVSLRVRIGMRNYRGTPLRAHERSVVHAHGANAPVWS